MAQKVFAAGSNHSATVDIAIGPANLPCTAQLYMSRDGGVTKKSLTTIKDFTSAGNTSPVRISFTGVAMPSGSDAGYSYATYLDVTCAGALIQFYDEVNLVIIPYVGVPVIGWT